MANIDEMISRARERVPPKPTKPKQEPMFQWWKLPTEEELDKQAAAEESKGFEYIPGKRPAEEGGNYE